MKQFSTSDIISIQVEGKVVTILFRDHDDVYKLYLNSNNTGKVVRVTGEDRKKAVTRK